MNLVQRFQAVRDRVVAFDADAALIASMAAFIELAAARYPVDPGARWQPGVPLELLFCGYAGTRNTGADLRVEEMIRQTRWLLGDEHVAIRILTINPTLTRGYFPMARQIHLPQVFPKFTVDAVHGAHGVVACEGSMFKSKFANALSTLMVGALGTARAEYKPAIGWGGEAGAMDAPLESLVRRYVKDAFVLCRNDASREVLAQLGVTNTTSGTDTAWSLPDPDPTIGEDLLRGAGWDGKMPVLWVAPIHPFWWPVKPDLARAAAWALTGHEERSHFQSIYFHHAGEEVDRKFAAYLDALSQAVRRFVAVKDHFVAVLGMEQLDRPACEGFALRVGGAPVFVSDRHIHREMLSLLRRGSLLLTSRYHAAVCSMPAGVPSVAVTMDERLRNLFDDRGTPELCLAVDAPDLGERLFHGLVRAYDERDALRAANLRTTHRNLAKMGKMGLDVVAYLRRELPDLPIRPELGTGGDVWAHLPPLDSSLLSRLEHVVA